MKKIAVFGKPGSDKSTLSKELASITGIQLHPLDSIVYKQNSGQSNYDKAHDNILAKYSWIIDGFGPRASFNERLAAADILLYIDLPYEVNYWLVTKRLLKDLFIKFEGWSDSGSVSKGSIEFFKTSKLCPMF